MIFILRGKRLIGCDGTECSRSTQQPKRRAVPRGWSSDGAYQFCSACARRLKNGDESVLDDISGRCILCNGPTHKPGKCPPLDDRISYAQERVKKYRLAASPIG